MRATKVVAAVLNTDTLLCPVTDGGLPEGAQPVMTLPIQQFPPPVLTWMAKPAPSNSLGLDVLLWLKRTKPLVAFYMPLTSNLRREKHASQSIHSPRIPLPDSIPYTLSFTFIEYDVIFIFISAIIFFSLTKFCLIYFNIFYIYFILPSFSIKMAVHPFKMTIYSLLPHIFLGKCFIVRFYPCSHVILGI